MCMLSKCIISASNHCEVYRQRSLTQDLLNAIIYSAGRGHSWITGTGVCSNSTESATKTSITFALACQLGSLGLWFPFAGAVLQPLCRPTRRYHPLRQVSLLPPPAPPTHSRIMDDHGGWRGMYSLWSSCVMLPFNSCQTCSDACNIGFPRYNSSQYSSIRYIQYRLRYDTDPIIVRSLILRVSCARD